MTASPAPQPLAQIVSGLELWYWQNEAKQKAIAAQIPPTEVDWLLQDVAPLDRLSLRLETFKTQPEIPLRRSLHDLTALWQRRIDSKVPVQYLLGSTPWRKFALKVSPAVLIPRPETEEIIDLAQQATQEQENLQFGNWADLGTGSGAIALGLAEVFPKATLHAVDYSLEALQIAQENAWLYFGDDQDNQIDDRIQFYQGSWFEPLAHLRNNLSGMVSNPPYIPTALIPDLQPEVSQHEPHLALDGGTDGLDCIRHLVATAPDYLVSGGVWLVELMAGQAETVIQLLQNQGNYTRIQAYKDLSGIDRFVLAYRV